jgi:micrococcal nuclease
VVLGLRDGRHERTHLIRIDAPESRDNAKLARDAKRGGQDRAAIQALGRQATAFTEHLLPPDTPVGVEPDAQPRDRYDRLLAYLWLPDGSMVNVTIVRTGTPSRSPSPAALFRRCAQEAREQGRELWRQP